MSKLIRLSKSCIGEEEKQAVLRVLDSEYLGMGQEVMLFEKELEIFFSNKVYVACVNTGTSALQLAIQACGIGHDDEIIIPSITYVASFQATSAMGTTPIACDIDPKTGSLDLESVRKKITPRTKAIMHVHYASGLGERSEIFALAKKFNLRVIEDAAHSFGSYDNQGNRIGENGDILCFSFDGIKNITCGEGGVIVSCDKNLIDRVRDLRLLGVEKDTDNRYAGKRSWDFDVKEQGWRYHMSNINAAIGREQLKKIDIFGIKRRHIATLYKRYLKDLPIEFLDINYDQVVPHIFPILVEESKRNFLREFLLENHVETGIHYKPNHLLTKYQSMNCSKAEVFGHRILTLPMHVDLSDHCVERVSDLLRMQLVSYK